MKSRDSNSVMKHQRPENREKCVKTLEDTLDEIQEIIKKSLWVETRLAKLESKGYMIEHCWVKNGNIGAIWYMKRMQVYRVQVTDSEFQGKYFKAYCVILPEIEVDLKNYDTSMIRNLWRK